MIKLRVLNCFAVFDWRYSLVSLIEGIDKLHIYRGKRYI